MTPLLERHFHVTLIELVAFEISVVIARCKAHLVQLSALDEGGGTNCSNIFVGEGDNTLSGAADEVGGSTLTVEVVGGPAEVAGAIVGALSAVMAGILAMAGEAVGKRWQFALAEYGPWGSAWLSHSTTFKTVFALTTFRGGVSGSLSGVEAGDDA
jgi:hypothetical protein